jgi:hypothetical protein
MVIYWKREYVRNILPFCSALNLVAWSLVQFNIEPVGRRPRRRGRKISFCEACWTEGEGGNT